MKYIKEYKQIEWNFDEEELDDNSKDAIIDYIKLYVSRTEGQTIGMYDLEAGSSPVYSNDENEIHLVERLYRNDVEIVAYGGYKYQIFHGEYNVSYEGLELDTLKEIKELIVFYEKYMNESNSWKDDDKYKFDILFIPSGELIPVKYKHFQEFFKDTLDGENFCKFNKEYDKWTIHDKHRNYFRNVIKQLHVDDILKDIDYLGENIDINWEDVDEEEVSPKRKMIDLGDLGIGDILYAKDDFYMNGSGKQFLIKDKGYKIDWIGHGLGMRDISLTTEVGSDHYFDLDKSLNVYFYTI